MYFNRIIRIRKLYSSYLINKNINLLTYDTLYNGFPNHSFNPLAVTWV